MIAHVAEGDGTEAQRNVTDGVLGRAGHDPGGFAVRGCCRQHALQGVRVERVGEPSGDAERVREVVMALSEGRRRRRPRRSDRRPRRLPFVSICAMTMISRFAFAIVATWLSFS